MEGGAYPGGIASLPLGPGLWETDSSAVFWVALNSHVQLTFYFQKLAFLEVSWMMAYTLFIID